MMLISGVLGGSLRGGGGGSVCVCVVVMVGGGGLRNTVAEVWLIVL